MMPCVRDGGGQRLLARAFMLYCYRPGAPSVEVVCVRVSLSRSIAHQDGMTWARFGAQVVQGRIAVLGSVSKSAGRPGYAFGSRLLPMEAESWISFLVGQTGSASHVSSVAAGLGLALFGGGGGGGGG